MCGEIDRGELFDLAASIDSFAMKQLPSSELSIQRRSD
jgi:hypothetical protein